MVLLNLLLLKAKIVFSKYEVKRKYTTYTNVISPMQVQYNIVLSTIYPRNIGSLIIYGKLYLIPLIMQLNNRV